MTTLGGGKTDDGGQGFELGRCGTRWDLTDGGVGAAVRRYYITVIPVILVIGVAVTTIVLGILDESVGLLAVFGALLVSGGLMLIYGFFYASKKANPLITPDRAPVLLQLEKEDSKKIKRQISGSAPVDPDRLVVSCGVAIQMLPGLALQLFIIPGQLLVFTGGVVNDSGFRLSWAIPALITAALFIIMFRQFRKTLRFLKETQPEGVSG